MKILEQMKRSAADLHWLATLLTGCREIAADVTVEAIGSAVETNGAFSNWMRTWSRKIVVAKALEAIRGDLAQSARRTELRRSQMAELPPRSWAPDRETTKRDLERALLPIDVFPRCAVLLLAFERLPLEDAAILLNSKPDLVRTAMAAGLRDLTINLARMQGWKSVSYKSTMSIREGQYV